MNPVQKLQIAADKRRNLPAVWHVATNKLVVIGKSFDENVTPIRNTTQALVSEFTPYLMERSIGRGAADWFIADLTTGARTSTQEQREWEHFDEHRWQVRDLSRKTASTGRSTWQRRLSRTSRRI